jgi:hypothetical protein
VLTEVWEELFERFDESVEHLQDQRLLLDDIAEKPRERERRRDGACTSQEVEATQLAELGVAMELTEQRLRGWVLKDDAGENGVPGRSNWVVVTTVASTAFELCDDLLIWEVLEDKLESEKVGRCFDLFPREEVLV